MWGSSRNKHRTKFGAEYGLERQAGLNSKPGRVTLGERLGLSEPQSPALRNGKNTVSFRGITKILLCEVPTGPRDVLGECSLVGAGERITDARGIRRAPASALARLCPAQARAGRLLGRVRF